MTTATLFQLKNQQIADAAIEMLRAERPMTLRQLFYRLVSAGYFPATDEKYYKRLSTIMKKVREAGLVPFEWMVDETRTALKPASWDSLADFGEAVRHSFRRNFWNRQDCHVEIIVEKQALVGVLAPVTEEFDVSLRAIKGYSSVSASASVARAWRSIEKPVFAYYCGDFDASGFDIERAAATKIFEYGDGEIFESYDDDEHRFSWIRENGHRVEWYRLGVLKSDFAEFNLLPLQVKDTDSRSGAFRERYGDQCAEIDALPATELRARVRNAIKNHIDQDAWAEMESIQAREQEQLEEFVTQLESGHDSFGSDE